jgi:hypothetical protein
MEFKRTMERIHADSPSTTSTHVLEKRCGCTFSVQTCFYFAHVGRHYVITTGVPGCGSSPDAADIARSTGVDPSHCGDVAEVIYGQRARQRLPRNASERPQ